MYDHFDQQATSVAQKRKQPINIADAKARLSELVERAAGGEEIILARNGEPQARLVPLEPRKKRMPGRGAGRWKLAPDFDAPLPSDVQASFEGPKE